MPMQKTLTINLPDSAEAVREVLRTLLRFGIISRKEVIDLEQEEPVKQTRKKSRWALTAEEMSKENFLDNGLGEELRNYIHEFREGFAFKNNFESTHG